jgi:DNA-binding NtrC family response regulator
MRSAVADRLLLVEDTPSLSMLYSSVLAKSGHGVACAFSLAEARAHCERVRPSLVLLDLQLPDGDGLDLLASLRRDAPETRTIVITANGSINRAVQAMRAGAFDFLVKPFDEARLLSAVGNALASAPDPVEEEGVDQTPAGFQGFIGRSAAMQDIYRMIRSIGRSTATVFITGESGTGKEVAARAIHAMSTRAAKPFVPLNCAAIPRDLLESEVFGHLKGAFTGALSDKPGAAAVADGGTLFLDEICEMDLSLQTKLLRFLQTSTIQPVGAARPIPVDVRIVCATNRDPAEEVRAGRFREDLYYRLHVVPIHMPPLRARPEDIMDIAQASLVEFAAEEGKSFAGFHPAAAAILVGRPWPGNVRQLLNVIRNTVVLHDGPLVEPAMLPPDMASSAAAPAPERVAQMPPARPLPGSSTRERVELLVGTALADVERELIEATIAHCDGSIPRAAKVLEVSPSTLYRKLESWTGAQRRSGT